MGSDNIISGRKDRVLKKQQINLFRVIINIIQPSNHLCALWVLYVTFHGIKRAIRRKPGLLLEWLVLGNFEPRKD
jgi:hypothetical protein